MHTETARLPKGMGYACRPSVLEAALIGHGIQIEWSLRRKPTGAFFDCHFWPANFNVKHERLYLGAVAVPNPVTGRARRYFEAEVVPELMAWIKTILALPLDSTVRREPQYFVRMLPPEIMNE